MAEMLPGEEMHRRRSRTTNPQRLHEDTPYAPGHPFYRSMMPTSTSAMDEATLKARQRLAQKLGYFHPTSVNRFQSKEGRGREDSDAHLGSFVLVAWKILEQSISKSWNFHGPINTTQNVSSRGSLFIPIAPAVDAPVLL
ncbi:unnamed protein product [Camellia sinensis]